MTGSGTPASKTTLRQPRDKTPLPKRFYTSATTAPAEGGHTVLLDGRPIRTPGKTPLVVPSPGFARALAAEWDAQAETIDPTAMPLTRLANTARDGVAGREQDIRAEIVKYAGSDLLCYRASHPSALVERQAEAWDPVLDWAQAGFGITLAVGDGIMPIEQDAAELEKLHAAVAEDGCFALTGLHVMMTLTGSALLALAVRAGHLNAAAAWNAAHIDEDWQIEQWGEDAEAQARREHHWVEMAAAARMIDLLG